MCLNLFNAGERRIRQHLKVALDFHSIRSLAADDFSQAA